VKKHQSFAILVDGVAGASRALGLDVDTCAMRQISSNALEIKAAPVVPKAFAFFLSGSNLFAFRPPLIVAAG